MEIRFGDHASFHRAAAGTVGGALLGGIACHFVTGSSDVAPLLGGLTGVAAGAAWGYGKPLWRVLAAALAAVPLLALALGWPALAIAAALGALGAVVGGTSGVRGARGLLAIGAAGAAIALAMWCALRVDTAAATHAWPGWAIDGAAAAAMGMVAVVALLPRHLQLAIDPIDAAVRRLPRGLDREVRALCDRSAAIWSSFQRASDLDDSDPNRALVCDGVLKTLEVAVKSAEVKIEGSEAELAARIAELEQRIAASADAEVKQQYTAALGALTDQRRYREHLVQSRERLVARMHNHVAALERFQLAAITFVAQPAAPQLAELSSEVAASGEALAELQIDAA